MKQFYRVRLLSQKCMLVRHLPATSYEDAVQLAQQGLPSDLKWQVLYPTPQPQQATTWARLWRSKWVQSLWQRLVN